MKSNSSKLKAILALSMTTLGVSSLAWSSSKYECKFSVNSQKEIHAEFYNKLLLPPVVKVGRHDINYLYHLDAKAKLQNFIARLKNTDDRLNWHESYYMAELFYDSARVMDETEYYETSNEILDALNNRLIQFKENAKRSNSSSFKHLKNDMSENLIRGFTLSAMAQFAGANTLYFGELMEAIITNATRYRLNTEMVGRLRAKIEGVRNNAVQYFNSVADAASVYTVVANSDRIASIIQSEIYTQFRKVGEIPFKTYFLGDKTRTFSWIEYQDPTFNVSKPLPADIRDTAFPGLFHPRIRALPPHVTPLLIEAPKYEGPHVLYLPEPVEQKLLPERAGH